MSKSPLTFRIFQGGKLVREETLALGVIKLGKVPSAHLRLDDESVSRMHAIIEVDNAGAIHLIDLGSTRGTFVNGAKINKAQITDGDVLTVGDTRIELSVAAVAATLPVPVPVLAPVPVPVPVPVSFLSTPAVSPAQLAAAFASTTDEPGASAVEVAAMLGDSVVEVKHCMDPRSGKVTRGTYALFGASLVCAAAAATSFFAGVNVAARNKAGLDYWTHTAHKPVYSFRAEPASGALDVIEIGGLALGLAAAAAGLSRARRERRSPYFRIGTAPGVELATEAAPSASFPLVAPSGDDFVFNFAAGMDGELVLGGTSTPLAELAASGRARPSAIVAGALELPIPATARIRARMGATSFLISAVAKPKAQAAPLFALDSRAAMYAAASLVAHLGLYGLSRLGTADAASIGINTNTSEETGIVSTSIDHETAPPPVDPNQTGEDKGKSDSGGGRMELTEGAAGKPTSTNDNGQMAIKDNHLATPQVAREQAMAYARESGILGDTSSLTSAISALNGTADLSQGFDTNDYVGPLFGGAGEGKGNFGMGRTGWGPGGGCLNDCGGIGTGRYHTIGNGPGAGVGWRPGTGVGPGLPGHVPMVPNVVIPQPRAVGDLDKAIIKRYVNREKEKIAYCYESELLAHPGMQGDITVQFFIAPDGSVQSSTGQGFNDNVARCVAGVVHAISFPAPHDGGGVQVNYPFHFHMAAAQ